jgi:sporulation protein YlmC with PRC-barrel domain
MTSELLCGNDAPQCWFRALNLRSARNPQGAPPLAQVEEAEFMLKSFRMIAIASLFMWADPLAVCAKAEKVDPEATEMAAELVGAPVFSTDGVEVGEVADIKFDEKLQPHSLRILTAAVLGLGTRIVEVPKDAFIALRGAVALRVPAEAMEAFPEASSDLSRQSFSRARTP